MYIIIIMKCFSRFSSEWVFGCNSTGTIDFDAFEISVKCYEIIKIPILAPHDHSHFTMLSTNFEGIAYRRDSEYFLVIQRLTDLPQNEILDLRKTKLVLQSRTKPTCGLALPCWGQFGTNQGLLSSFCRSFSYSWWIMYADERFDLAFKYFISYYSMC